MLLRSLGTELLYVLNYSVLCNLKAKRETRQRAMKIKRFVINITKLTIVSIKKRSKLAKIICKKGIYEF